MSDNVRAHQERESIMTKTSRFNYIKRGLVGVCAATMLTGLCAGTAFGGTVTGSVSSANNNFNDGATAGLADASASTAVGLDPSQVDLRISATVPQTVSLAIDNAGTLVLPSDKISIKNTSTLVPLVLKTVSASVPSGAPVKLVASDASPAAGDLILIATPTGGTAIDMSTGVNNGTNKIGVKVGSTDGSLDMTLGGSLGPVNSTLLNSIVNAGGSAINFVNVAWTVAADTATA